MTVGFQGLPQINSLPRRTLFGAHLPDLPGMVFFIGTLPGSSVLADMPTLAAGVLEANGSQLPPSLDN